MAVLTIEVSIEASASAGTAPTAAIRLALDLSRWK
jgi:hypothetical protein